MDLVARREKEIRRIVKTIGGNNSGSAIAPIAISHFLFQANVARIHKKEERARVVKTIKCNKHSSMAAN